MFYIDCSFVKCMEVFFFLQNSIGVFGITNKNIYIYYFVHLIHTFSTHTVHVLLCERNTSITANTLHRMITRYQDILHELK